MTSLITPEDFLQSEGKALEGKTPGSPEWLTIENKVKRRYEKNIAAFYKNWNQFLETYPGFNYSQECLVTIQSLIRAYIKNGRLAGDRNLAFKEAQARSRERKKLGVKLSLGGKGGTMIAYLRNDLIHFMTRPFLIASKETRLTLDEASEWLAKWLIVLGLEHRGMKIVPPPQIKLKDQAILENRSEQLAHTLRETRRDWDPRELPNLPRGLGVSSKPRKGVYRLNERKPNRARSTKPPRK